MHIVSNKENEFLIIGLSGELDAGSAILLDQEIEQALQKNERFILVDCSKLDYISSAGLGVFMSYLQDFEEKNIAMRLYGLSDKVMNVFKILGLDNLLSIVKTKQDALNTSIS